MPRARARAIRPRQRDARNILQPDDHPSVENEIPRKDGEGGMTPLNHSCRGPLGADCGGVWRVLNYRCSNCDDITANSFRGPRRLPADRSRSRIELVNRICIQQVVTIPGDRPSLFLSLSRAAFPFPLIRGAYFRRAAFPRWDPRGWIAESSPHTRTLVCPHERALLAGCSCRAV